MLRSKWLWLAILLAVLPAFAMIIYRSSQPFEVQLLNSGVPIANADLTYMDNHGVEHAVTTNAEGKARFPNAPREGAMWVQFGEGFMDRGGTILSKSKGRRTIDYYPDRTVDTTRTLFGTRTITSYPTPKEQESKPNEVDDLSIEPKALKKSISVD